MIPLAVLALFAGLLLPAPDKPDGPRPVTIFFGDSLTLGLHASRPELSYRALVTERLQQTPDAGPSAAVIQDLYGLLDDAERRVPYVLLAHPTLVFLELGHHEVEAGDGGIAMFESRYATILDQLLASGAAVIPSTLAWLDYPPGSAAYRNAERINAIIRRLAAERDLVVADLWGATDRHSEMISTERDPSFMPPYRGDSFHPNDAGHRALAEAFWRAYLRLRKRPPVPESIIL